MLQKIVSLSLLTRKMDKKELSYFKSDFKLVLEYLRMERTGTAEEWDRQKVSHIHDLLNLLKSISRNEIVTTMEDFIIQTQGKEGGIQMSDLFQTYWNKGHSEGVVLGVKQGRSEGISFATKVMALLYEQGREVDIKRALTDSAYFQQLLAEYQS